jgi:hypothetical protein
VLDEAIDHARAAVAAERARRRRDNTPEHREHPA